MNFILWAALFAMASGCTGGGCSGCAFEELPEGGLPAAQTVEGGAQVRITETGFETIEGLIVALLDDAIGSGFQLGSQEIFDIGFQSVDICPNGCDLGLTINDFITQINQANDSLTVGANFDANGELVLSASGLFNTSCTLTATVTDAVVSFDLGVRINNGSGELELYSENVNELSLGNTSANGCGVLGDVIDLGFDLLGSVTDFLTGQLSFLFQPILNPIIDLLLEQFLPDPLGLEGVLDMGALLADFSPSTDATLETKLIPGGYADIVNNGLSIGMISGFNSDRDPSTRNGDEASEPVFCVPAMPAPNFAAAPHLLTTTPRNYGNPFSLQPADEFLGSPDPAGTDILLGASETMLDQLGHHLVTGGTLCLSVSTEAIPQFNLGIIGLVVPSFSELGNDDGTNPLKLVIRPLEAVDFEIGEGTDTDPAIKININDLEIDFYAFIFERWVRGFTIRLNAQIGIDLEFTTDGSGNPAVLPILSGLDADDLQITVLNEDFLRESAAELEAVFPTLLDLALPLVTSALGEITLPDFGGFTLDNLSLTKVTTSEDDFVAISGGLASTQTLLPLVKDKYPTLAAKLEAMQVTKPVKVDTRAQLAEVAVPIPQAVRNSLLAGRTGVWPEVSIDVPTHDSLGRELEYTWSLNGGLWRPFTTGGQLIIRDGAFAIQGNYEVHVRARAIGDYASLDSTSVVVPVTIDSAPPRIHAHRVTSRAGVTYIPATDLVSETVRIALSPVGAEGPTTGWSYGTVSAGELNAIAGDDGKVVVYAEDESGNQSQTVLSVLPTTGSAGCSSAGGAISGTLL
ncbi:MAG: hypothetical protein KJO07_21075, partial [Deltaproteobacteria bacterium]|nr:hypothetical protein [Deltaproteobacteria bacterium]